MNSKAINGKLLQIGLISSLVVLLSLFTSPLSAETSKGQCLNEQGFCVLVKFYDENPGTKAAKLHTNLTFTNQHAVLSNQEESLLLVSSIAESGNQGMVRPFLTGVASGKVYKGDVITCEAAPQSATKELRLTRNEPTTILYTLTMDNKCLVSF